MTWHKELYVIHKQGKVWSNNYNRGFRLKTKQQLLYVSAGGTSIHVSIDNNHFRIITKNNKDYLQITNYWYNVSSPTFGQCLTFQDELKLKREELQTEQLPSYFYQKTNGGI